MTTDLERILGYQDAVDSSSEIRKVADEIYAFSCWTPEFCGTLIRAAELTGAFEFNPHDPVPGHEVSLAVLAQNCLMLLSLISACVFGRNYKNNGH